MATCPECHSLYGEEVTTCPDDGSALVPGDFVDDSLEAGTMVGEYRIGKKIGSGTFGDVYAGEHPLIGKTVAVKVLNRRFASDPGMVSRFVAEARAVNKIRQRNIIDIFSFGVLPDKQQHYFVMELLDGLTLGDLLEKTPRLPVRTVLSIARDVAAGLDAVHAAGITHRDLKPDNIFLVTERDGTYFPKLLDFGIAKLVGEDLAHKTGSGVVLGTPRYMSPEQARGKKADRASDIYALGVMIHEMLTGEAPFVGESSIEVLLRHTTEIPQRVSSVRPTLPRELDAPVLAMLAKRPNERPASAGEAVAALWDAAHRARVEGVPSLAGRGIDARREVQERLAKSDETTVIEAQRAPAPAVTAVLDAAPKGGSSQQISVVPPGQGLVRAAPLDHTLAAPSGSYSGHTDSGRALGERSGQPTEGLAAVETGDPRERRATSLRWKLATVAAVAIASAASILALRRSSEQPANGHTPPSGVVVSTPSIAQTASDRTAPSPSPSASASEPTVTADVQSTIELKLSTRPADVDVWLGDHKLGTSRKPIAVQRGSSQIELVLKKPGFKDEIVRLTPDRNQALEATLSAPPRGDGRGTGKPASTKGRLDNLLGDRD